MSRNPNVPQPVIVHAPCRDFCEPSSLLVGRRLDDRERHLIYEYPTVYVVYASPGHAHAHHDEFTAYVGETNNIVARTNQHLVSDPKTREDWARFARMAQRDRSSVLQFVIGNEHFNKSLTLDVENRLMQYLLGVDAVTSLNNRRANAQGDYYTHDELDPLFSKIWRKLNRENPALFPAESIIRDSALFKASPFHRLTGAQISAEEKILLAVQQTLGESAAQTPLADGELGKLILVQGVAGTGKTVLVSHLFNRLFREGVAAIDPEEGGQVSAYILIQHEEQHHVYDQIATKLGLQKRPGTVVLGPTTFINKFSEQILDRNGSNTGRGRVDRPLGRADIALVDEAHLLLTQGNQGYSGKNMLLDIMRRAKVTVAVFDADQILQTAQQWDEQDLRALLGEEPDNAPVYRDAHLTTGQTIQRLSIRLEEQMRIAADEKTIRWIDDLIAGRGISTLPRDPGEWKGKKQVRAPYEIKVFASPLDLHRAICDKAESDEGRGLSRVLATYDWPYSSNRNEADPNGHWNVELHEDVDGMWVMGPVEGEYDGRVPGEEGQSPKQFRHPWNYCLVRRGTRTANGLAWAENPDTIEEIGSTYTIQGFDLNFAGVIIGPSVKLRDGKLVFDASASKNRQATNRRGGTLDYSEKNLRNELSVLLRRGVHGLYLFAVDQQLQAALLRAQAERDAR